MEEIIVTIKSKGMDGEERIIKYKKKKIFISKTKNEEKTIIRICELLQENKLSQKEISELCKVSYGVVHAIFHHETWIDISRSYVFPDSSSQNLLSNKMVEDICNDLQFETHLSCEDIAKKYRISGYNVNCIYRKQIWIEIASKYLFPVRKHLDDRPDEVIKNICEDLQYTDLRISELNKKHGLYNVDTALIGNILRGLSYTRISKDYDFSKRLIDIRKRDFITDELAHQICQSLEKAEEETFVDYAKKFNVTVDLVYSLYYERAHVEITSLYDFSNFTPKSSPVTKEEIIHKICEELQKGDLNQRKIASKLNVHYKMVSAIYNGKKFKNISKEYTFNKIYNIFTDKDIVIKICEGLQSNIPMKELSKNYDIGLHIIKNIYNKKIFKDTVNHYSFPEYYPPKSVPLDEDTVRKICMDLQENILSGKEIAKKYNTIDTTISGIKHQKSYINITKDYDFSKLIKTPITIEIIHSICKNLQESSLSCEAIGKMLNVSDSSVYSIYSKKSYVDISINYTFIDRKKKRNKNLL